ncbi:MAG: hypothetical protein FWG90_02720 [Oscillospiraceae bacterium]|nr:hypothetical protein [Oscillospiraceae bacterium]
MAKKVKLQEQSLETIMWNCRNSLRGTVGGNEKNRDAVMGLVSGVFMNTMLGFYICSKNLM